MPNRLLIAALLLPLSLVPAQAHVMLIQKSAKPGSEFQASFRVGHGCAGSPTVALRVELPATLSRVTVPAKPGWTVKIERSADGHVRAVLWKGTLANDKPEIFTIGMRVPNKPDVLVFPATQTCTNAEEHWSEPPSVHGKNPAPALTVSPDGAAPDAMPDMAGMPGMH